MVSIDGSNQRMKKFSIHHKMPSDKANPHTSPKVFFYEKKVKEKELQFIMR